MERILSCPSLSESGLSAWVADAIGVLDRWVAGGLADALGIELTGPPTAWIALTLLVASLPVISLALALRTRARRRRARRELKAHLRQGVGAAAGRAAASGASPRPSEAAAAGTDAAPAGPRVEASPPARAEAPTTPAPRDQGVLLERIVTDASDRALGGGKLAPPNDRPRRSTNAGSPAPPDPGTAGDEIPRCYRRANAEPAAGRAPELRPPSRAAAAQERQRGSPVTPKPRPVTQRPARRAVESLPRASETAGRTPRSITSAKVGPQPDPGSLERALAEAWSQAVHEEAAPSPPAETRQRPSTAQPPVARPAKATGPPESTFRALASCNPPLVAVPAAEQLDRSLGEAWERALATAEDPEPAGASEDARPAADSLEPSREAPPAPSKADPSPAQGPTLDHTDPVEHERLVALVFAKGRLDEAARLTREGLTAHPGTIELLLQLSRADAELGHPDEAIAAARDAHLRCRSRDSLTHLLRLLSATRGFTPEDGERLRRAVRKHPDAPILLQAAGMFEAIHGDPWAAIGLLGTALRLESDQGIRREIERELARLEASGDRAARGVTPITEGI